jgi:hypothetical protein
MTIQQKINLYEFTRSITGMDYCSLKEKDKKKNFYKKGENYGN